MRIRRACEKDLPRIEALLYQVAMVHHRGRPDLFKAGEKKYAREELLALLEDGERPILVAVDGEDSVMGYAFCICRQHTESHVLTDVKTLYIDDLCVDESCRGRGVGSALYRSVLALAKERGCYNVTLNVWSCNRGAMAFYERCGLKPQKVGLEVIL